MFNQNIHIIKRAKILFLLTAFAFTQQTYSSDLIEEKQSRASLLPIPYEHFKKLGTLSNLPQETVHEIFSYCPNALIPLNRASFTIITGYKTEDVSKKGIETLPSYKGYPFLPSKKINFGLTQKWPADFKSIEDMASYIWYKRVASVQNISYRD